MRHILSIFVFLTITVSSWPGQALELTNPYRTLDRPLVSASEYDYPPFSVVRPNGTADGFSVQLLTEVAKAVGLEVSFKVGPWHEIKQALIDGQLDVLPLVSYSPERDKVLDFTASYLRMHGTIFVRKDQKSIHSEADLKDRDVLVMEGDTAHEYAVKNNLTTKLILTQTFEQAMTMLSSGKHDAVIIQQLVGHQIIRKLNIDNLVDIATIQEDSLKPTAEPISGFEQRFCIAVQQGNRDLLDLLNEGLTITIANGTYQALYDKWFTPILPSPAASFADIFKYLAFIVIPVLAIGIIFTLFVLKKQVARRTKALQTREGQLKTLIESIPDLVWLKDPHGVYLSCNQKFERFFGEKEAKIIGKTDYDFVEKPLADFFRENDEKALQAGRPVINEEEVVFADDGHKEMLETIKTPMYDSRKELIGVLGIGRDITHRKMAAEELKRNKDQLESILSNIQGITYRCRMEKDWTMIYMTDQVQELTGYPAGDFIDNRVRTYESIIHAQDTQTVYHAVLEAVKARQPWEIEYRIHHRTDGIRWVYEKGKGVFDSGGDIQYLDGFILNITQQKHALKEKGKLENQLRQAQKMEAIGRLAGGVAHDFNNMLSIILGNAELMMIKLDADHPSHSHLKEIQHAARRSADLTRQLLAFARKQTISPEVIDPNQIIEGMLKILKRLMGEDIDLAWQPANSVWPVKMDPSQVDQILANLCVNARDAIKDVGKVTIETGNLHFDEAYCRAHKGFQPGDYVVIGVSDNGCGMEKETVQHLFEPFYTTKENGAGTGLGLATVYGIVKQNKGFINVYSEAGQGTTFKIYLSRHREQIEPQPGQKIPQAPLEGHETILLVEDEKAILEMVRKMLELLGYTVLAANQPEEAIRLASDPNMSIDLLMTDVVMPSMNGRQLAEKILVSRPKIKCLYMSGYTANVIAHRGILDEGLNFINKPFSKQALSTQLREILD